MKDQKDHDQISGATYISDVVFIINIALICSDIVSTGAMSIDQDLILAKSFLPAIIEKNDLTLP